MLIFPLFQQLFQQCRLGVGGKRREQVQHESGAHGVGRPGMGRDRSAVYRPGQLFRRYGLAGRFFHDVMEFYGVRPVKWGLLAHPLHGRERVT